MATHNYAYDMTIEDSDETTTQAAIFAAKTAASIAISPARQSSGLGYNDIMVQHNGKDINVGETLAELDMYKSVFSTAFAELGIDINDLIEKHKFLTKLSS